MPLTAQQQTVAYLTPGVYRHPWRTEQRDIRLVRTDVPGFAGFTQRGPLLQPGDLQPDPRKVALRLTSWKEFLAHFGGFMEHGYLAYAVRAFFENGGTTCYVMRVAATHSDRVLGRPREATLALPTSTRVSAQDSDAPTLAAEVKPEAIDIDVDNAFQVATGDLVGISQGNVTEFVMVVARDGNTLHLARCLKGSYSKGTALSVYDAALQISALSAGHWGNRIRLRVTPLTSGEQIVDFALRVTVTPRDPGVEVPEEEFYSRLSLARPPKGETNPYFAETLVNGFSNLIRVEVVQKEGEETKPLVTEGSPVERGPAWLQGGHDGLSDVTVSDFTGGLDDLRGLRLLEEIDEVAILCVPDAVLEQPVILAKATHPPPDPCKPQPEAVTAAPIVADPTTTPPVKSEAEVLTIYRAMLDQCERLRDRVAILDVPSTKRTLASVNAWRTNFSSRFGALYYPWLKVPDALDLAGPTRQVPPTGHVAGVYARIDNAFGVQRPPANAALEFATNVVQEISDAEQQELNPYGINAIRGFQGRGIRVWGARSVAGNQDTDWQFIHVRRLMCMIEESVDKSMQWAAFEPNDGALRQTLVHSLSVFLETIWRKGGLKGAIPAEAFYVKCDETNNPQRVVDAGQLVCQVGVAIAAPMEFIIFEIRQLPTGSEITET